eukprot:gene8879-6390_t
MSDYRTFQTGENSRLLASENRQAMMEKGLLTSTYDLQPGQKPYPHPLSLFWRIFHWMMYFNGGVTFFLGSMLLYSSIYAGTPSAILYTFGSATFLIADVTEWLTNNHVGCFWYADYEESYEASVQNAMDPKSTSSGRWQRAENGWNFFLSSVGSFFYLVGSSLFLPQIYAPVTALICFMVASTCIITAQCWKLYRAGLAPATSVRETSATIMDLTSNRRPEMIYSVANYQKDFSGFLVDFFVIFGALGYLLGSPMFFPSTDVNNTINDTAATIFTLGGFFYICSGTAMFYRYMFTRNYPH